MRFDFLQHVGHPVMHQIVARTRATTHVAAVFMAVAALSLGSVSDAAAAGRVFYDGFESGTGQWSQAEYHNKCTAVSSSVDGRPTRSGSSMLECNWNGVVIWSDAASFSGMKLNSFIYSREAFLRLWVRYATDVDHADGGKLFRLSPGGDSFYFGAQMQNTGGPMFSYWESINGQAGPINWGNGSSLGNGNWHEVEIYIKHNTTGSADGVLKIWEDGSLKQQALNLVTASSGSRWYPLYLMSNWSSNPGWEHDANNHVYWDDIEIFSDSGSGSSGSMADGTVSASGTTQAPSAPQNLRIVR